MTESTLKLLELVNKGYSVNEISEELNLSNKQLYHRLLLLSNKGFNFDRKYYYDGNIVYVPKTQFNQENNDGVNIITSPSDTVFQAIVISDLHLGKNSERIDLLNKIYDYCAKKGINIILNTGDIIHGMIGKKTFHNNISDQIDYSLKQYPFDKNILNFCILGNHDINPLTTNGQDFLSILNNYRHDIIPLGYRSGKINIKNDEIYLRHYIHGFPDDALKNKIVLHGHTHQMKIVHKCSATSIYVPPLSDVNYPKNEIPASALKLTLKFNNGYIWSGSIEHLLFGKNIYTINEIMLDLNRKTPVDFNQKTKLEEELKIKKKILTPLPSK